MFSGYSVSGMDLGSKITGSMFSRHLGAMPFTRVSVPLCYLQVRHILMELFV